MRSGGMPEWSNGAVLKTAEPQGSVGSNPTPSATFAKNAPIMSQNAHIAQLPPSKSHANRALVCAALSPQPVVFSGLLGGGDDIQIMLSGLRSLGVLVEEKGEIFRVGGGFSHTNHANIEVKNAGTASRFLLALAALRGASASFTSSSRMERRPLSPLLGALTSLGADIHYQKTPECFPLQIKPSELLGGSVSIRGDVSSQFLSALAMIGPRMPRGLSVSVEGDLASAPYVELTFQIMRQFGVEAKLQAIPSASYATPTQQPFCIPPDPSAAGHLAACAVAAGRAVMLPGVQHGPGEARLFGLLEDIGATTTATKQGLLVQGSGQIRAFDADFSDMPDMAMAAAPLCLLASGECRLSGLQTLAGKECDRFAVLAEHLRRAGAAVQTIGGHTLVVGPPAALPSAMDIQCHDDHRVAMGFAALAPHIPQLSLDAPECVAKSFPGFWGEVEGMLEAR